MFVLIHGRVCLAAVSLDGTFSSVDVQHVLELFPGGADVSYLFLMCQAKFSNIFLNCLNICSFPEVNFSSRWLWSLGLEAGIIQADIVVTIPNCR